MYNPEQIHALLQTTMAAAQRDPTATIQKAKEPDHVSLNALANLIGNEHAVGPTLIRSGVIDMFLTHLDPTTFDRSLPETCTRQGLVFVSLSGLANALSTGQRYPRSAVRDKVMGSLAKISAAVKYVHDAKLGDLNGLATGWVLFCINLSADDADQIRACETKGVLEMLTWAWMLEPADERDRVLRDHAMELMLHRPRKEWLNTVVRVADGNMDAITKRAVGRLENSGVVGSPLAFAASLNMALMQQVGLFKVMEECGLASAVITAMRRERAQRNPDEEAKVNLSGLLANTCSSGSPETLVELIKSNVLTEIALSLSSKNIEERDRSISSLDKLAIYSQTNRKLLNALSTHLPNFQKHSNKIKNNTALKAFNTFVSNVQNAVELADKVKTIPGMGKICNNDECRKLDDGSSGGFKVCGQCKSTKYCSRECQVACWKEHKKVCVLKKVEREARKSLPNPTLEKRSQEHKHQLVMRQLQTRHDEMEHLCLLKNIPPSDAVITLDFYHTPPKMDMITHDEALNLVLNPADQGGPPDQFYLERSKGLIERARKDDTTMLVASLFPVGGSNAEWLLTLTVGNNDERNREVERERERFVGLNEEDMQDLGWLLEAAREHLRTNGNLNETD